MERSNEPVDYMDFRIAKFKNFKLFLNIIHGLKIYIYKSVYLNKYYLQYKYLKQAPANVCFSTF